MRRTRVLSVSCRVTAETSGPRRLELNRRLIHACLDRAEAFDPDIVVLPEIILHQGVGPTAEAIGHAEPVPGPTTEEVAAKAQALNAHVLLPLLERSGGRVYNSAVLIGRAGEIVGTYRKYRATGYEIEDGIQPGEDIPVWTTDCGRVGCAICFDLEYDDVALALARQKAQLVLWPSMFAGGRHLAAWCFTHGFYMVKCTAAHGQIVDPLGREVAAYGPQVTLDDPPAVVRWTSAEINTDVKMYHSDFNGAKLPDVVRRYGGGVEIGLAPDEGRFVITSHLPDKTVGDIEQEFQLTDLRDYLDGAAEIRKRRLALEQNG